MSSWMRDFFFFFAFCLYIPVCIDKRVIRCINTHSHRSSSLSIYVSRCLPRPEGNLIKRIYNFICEFLRNPRVRIFLAAKIGNYSASCPVTHNKSLLLGRGLKIFALYFGLLAACKIYYEGQIMPQVLTLPWNKELQVSLTE